MNRYFVAVRYFVVLALSVSAIPAVASKEKEKLPLPTKILTAKTVFVDNQSGRAEIGDRFYQELKEWGRLRIVTDKTNADLVLVLTTRETEEIGTTSAPVVTNQVGDAKIASGGNKTYSYTSGTTYLTILDAKTGEQVWANAKPWSRRGASRDLVKDLKKRIEEQEKQQPK